MSKTVVGAADETTATTLANVRGLLATSFAWSSRQLASISDAPVLEQSRLAAMLREAGTSLERAGNASEAALEQAQAATSAAMRAAVAALSLADATVQRALFENIHVSSVVGESFAGMVRISDIQPSFRIDGCDVDPAKLVADWQESGLPGLILCVPGLFCDESSWVNAGQPSLAESMRAAGCYPVFVRFNPGRHISQNGHSLLALMEALFDQPAAREARVYVVTYSQGGLIFRSAMYQGLRQQARFPQRIRHALLINSPDGGSYLEKLGFWLGLGLELVPNLPVKAIGLLGNQRSDAIRDLSHGIIREQDWRRQGHLQRYLREHYFGELDGIEATQLYSLISPERNSWAAWLGDGIVEARSLTLLSDRVYRQQSQPDTRVQCLFGISHFQVLAADETRALLLRILTGTSA